MAPCTLDLGPESIRMKELNLTPKWRDLIRVLSYVAHNGDSVEGREAAMSELYRLADFADAANKRNKKEKK
jgi:hypothetical protein